MSRLPAAFVGSLFLVARVVDAVTDPMMGVLVDNTARARQVWYLDCHWYFGKFTGVHRGFSPLRGRRLYVYAITYLWGITYTIWISLLTHGARAFLQSAATRATLLFHESSRVSPDADGRIGFWAVATFGGDDQGQGFLSRHCHCPQQCRSGFTPFARSSRRQRQLPNSHLLMP